MALFLVFHVPFLLDIVVVFLCGEPVLAQKEAFFNIWDMSCWELCLQPIFFEEVVTSRFDGIFGQDVVPLYFSPYLAQQAAN